MYDRLLVGAVMAGLAMVISAGSATAAGMMWSSFLGGSSNDQVNGTTTDAAGNIYCVGTTSSANYPAVGNGYRSPNSGWGDVMVAKFSPDGRTMLWSALLGGSYLDDGRAIAVDAQGNVFVTGYTASTNFPVTSGVFRSSHAGMVDGFVSKLSPAGALMFSTFIGGSRQEWPVAIRVDAAGNPVVAGTTESYNFPTTAGVLKASRAPYFSDASDGFVCKLNTSGSALLFSSYVGTTTASDAINGMVLDASGQPVVVGWTDSKFFPTTTGAYDRSADYFKEGFVTKLNASASAYVFSSYLGGSNFDEPRSVGLDAAGNIYVAGMTGSKNFPLTSAGAQRAFGGGYWDAFLVVLSPAGGALNYGTLLGGGGDDKVYAMSVSPAGDVVITGETSSSNFATTTGASDITANGGIDAFVTRFAAGRLVYSSYLGSSGTDRGFSIAVQPSGLAVVAGQTTGGSFPSTLGLYDASQNSPGMTDGFFSCWDFSTGSALVSGVRQLSHPASLSTSFALGPNPFRGRTTISLALAQSASVVLKIRDIQGRVVRDLADEFVAAGAHSWMWDGTDNSRRAVSPGVYLVQVMGGEVSATKTITVLR